MKHRALLIFGCFAGCLVASLAGCGASHWQRTTSATATGCPADAISITPDSGHFDTLQSWYAECRGQRYRCTFVTNPGGNDRGGCYPVRPGG